MAKGLVAADLRSSTEEELDSKLAEAKIELFNLRFQAATGQLESHGRLRAVRKEIARIYTVKRERELGIVTLADEEADEDEGAPERRDPPWLPQGPRGPGGQRQDGQDRGGRRRGPGQAPEVRQGHPPHQEVQGARRGERLRDRRPGAADGDPTAVRD